jgi:hypothetical protein
MSPVAMLLAVLMPLTAAQAAPTAQLADGRLTLRNDHVWRTLEREAGGFRTVSVARADGSDALAVRSDEFLIRLLDGREFTVADYALQGEPALAPGDPAVATLTYVAAAAGSGAPSPVRVTYRLGSAPYLRKEVYVSVPEGGAVDRVQVERLRLEAPCKLGGRGEPVFVGTAWFAGTEYPGADNVAHDGLLTLTHYPGLAKWQADRGEWGVQSKTAVLGTGDPADPLPLAFSDYVDSIRLPARNFLQYNSWYDWQGDQLNLSNLTSTYQAYKTHLLDPYGLKMDAFVPDDGWQDYPSIWAPRANLYPEGFGPLRDAIQALGGRLGIWMPVNGTNLDTSWGAGEGYEKSDQGSFYCLVGPRYNAAIREATRRIITQGNLAYYKHDFNHLQCSAPGHGHLADAVHGHEANLDAELELLAYERQVQPGIFLNITSFVWLSPWWLQHADSIWMCASDFGYDKSYPQLAPREWDMSYRDVHFYHVYHDGHHLVPPSAMMTHGIIHGRYCKLGGDQETLREWSDNAVMYYGRGVQLKELYITPEMMPQEWWESLGQTTRWAVDNAQVLEKTIMVGGDPAKGEVYGYAHWLGDRGLLCLRNPGLQDQGVAIPFDKSVQFRGPEGVAYRARVVYPYVEDVATQFTSGKPLVVAVPGCSVMVFELLPGEARQVTPASVPALEGGAARITEGGTLEVTVPVPDEAMPRCELYLIARGRGRALGLQDVRLNGQAAEVRTADGSGWLIQDVNLAALRGKTARVEARIPGGGEAPFSGPEMNLSVWFLADRPVATGPLSSREVLPFQVSRVLRRQTVALLRDCHVSRGRARRALTQADLAGATAGKLRISVFDSNGEPEYRDKWITLNGQRLARVPANEGQLSAWEEHVLDLTPEQVAGLRLSNTVSVGAAGGDCYKLTGLALAVRLASEEWVESTSDDTVWCSTMEWQYAEGEAFRNGEAGPVEVGFR